MTAQTKILLVALFIVVVIAGVLVYLRYKQGNIGIISPPQEEQVQKIVAAKTASFMLTSSLPTVKVGQSFNVVLAFTNTKTDIAAFDAVISYDSEMLQVVEIKTTDVFQTYPRKLIEPDKKRLIVTGVQSDLAQNLAVSSGELATLVLTPLKSGATKLEFVVEGDKYTNMMNKTPANVLGKAEGVEITIQE